MVSYILMFGTILFPEGCGNGAYKPSNDPKTSENIVEEIAVDYGTYGAEAKDRINTLLMNLSDADNGAGARWKKVMDI